MMGVLKPLLAAMLFCTCSASAAGLHVEGKGEHARLVMPDAVKAAIEKVAPGFQPWRWQDYLVWVREDFVKWKLANAPYAVVADFNNDGIDDLVVDGHTRWKDMLIGVVSTAKGYVAQVIIDGGGPVSTPAEMTFYADERGKAGRSGTGLKDWLQYMPDEKRNDRSYAFTLNLGLIYFADGTANEPGVAYYYFRNGQFEMECSGEMC
jgi:hypothetical protein